MKQFLFVPVALLLIILSACNQQNQKQNTGTTGAAGNEKYSAIEGNWDLVSTEVNGKQTKPKRYPQQFKMFHDGFFSFVMYDESGKFHLAAAGSYEVNGNMYKEAFTYYSGDTIYINSKDWQKWEMKGDTLISYGFEKAEMPDGKDVTKEWNANGRFIEKRVRAKKR